MAEHFHVHPNHLSRIFQETYGTAPKPYLQRLKLERAARMLEETSVPVALAAEFLGLEGPHSFSRSFKKYWGMSPLEYRKQKQQPGG